MRHDVYIHYVRDDHGHGDDGDSGIFDILRILRQLQREGIKVAESPEVTAFRTSVNEALANIRADIQRLLDRPGTGLTDEDKAALAAIQQSAADVAAVVPEDGTSDPAARSRR